jgi:cysteine-rich repeat protein
LRKPSKNNRFFAFVLLSIFVTLPITLNAGNSNGFSLIRNLKLYLTIAYRGPIKPLPRKTDSIGRYDLWKNGYPVIAYCPSCTLVLPDICGDGIVGETEQCDDGNTESFDGCSEACNFECTDPTGTVCFMVRCGNGITESTEECDDGNSNDFDNCRNDCTIQPDEPENPLVTCYGCGAEGGCVEVTATESACSELYSEPTCGGSCPSGGDVELCTTPNPEDLPLGVSYRDYPDSRHISLCQTETSVRYIICEEGGGVTVSISDCEEGVPCVAGNCVADDIPVPTCEDSDVSDEYPTGRDPDTQGTTSGMRIDGGGDLIPYSAPDYCTVSGTSIWEYYCNADGTRGVTPISCDEGERCDDGACVPGAPPESTCEDSDVSDEYPTGRDPDTQGTVSGMRIDGGGDLIPYSAFDYCASTGASIWEYYCNADGTRGVTPISCDEGERCDDGACAPGCDGICARTEATLTSPGFVTGSDCLVQHDICRDSEVIRYECGAGGTPEEGASLFCLSGCDNGMCL